ncbi:hypothetical protein CC99x_008840 [Candidatus Berkiella cookevillensis]|uniref:Uncharacterized protein n=1 Tax=Candidatus Berkiella cookevillensis TaxID=437022 RepID=A0AAE3L4V5_9GAMM|nr:hypothetical protein [Candidatus Berkiella cookevillensis]MCS5709007.1 hypothetical protein [Candidatus Berkiella cookevillensis]
MTVVPAYMFTLFANGVEITILAAALCSLPAIFGEILNDPMAICPIQND